MFDGAVQWEIVNAVRLVLVKDTAVVHVVMLAKKAPKFLRRLDVQQNQGSAKVGVELHGLGGIAIICFPKVVPIEDRAHFEHRSSSVPEMDNFNWLARSCQARGHVGTADPVALRFVQDDGGKFAFATLD